ncbi:MAG: polyisoprenoid-binding protein [Deltaproteobacteria bacterium]|nr:MAG: polyisoprenoid-binding protein [Deltaproteobacteria bacterium]
MRGWLGAAMFLTTLGIAPGARAQTQTWVADPAHSAVHFEIQHMMISTVRGEFRNFEATLELDEKRIKNSKVTAKIDVGSIDTRVEKRDAHLKSPDFFDVAKYPSITFESTKVRRVGKKRLKVTGNLTIRGVTKPVTLDVRMLGVQKNPFTKTPTRGFHAEATINREDFGLTWNQALETGGVLVGKKVKILIDAEFVPKPEEQAAASDGDAKGEAKGDAQDKTGAGAKKE